jgi:hypothetical protein
MIHLHLYICMYTDDLLTVSYAHIITVKSAKNHTLCSVVPRNVRGGDLVLFSSPLAVVGGEREVGDTFWKR